MKDLISNTANLVTGFSAGSSVGLAKALYTFASADLNASNDIDDFMGNAAIALFKHKNFGLGKKRIVSYDIEGPANRSDFDMTSISERESEAECSTNSGKGRSILATITLRKIQQLNSFANIQLISYTPVESPYHGGGSFPTGREQILTEGMLSRKHKTWNGFSFTPINAFEEIKVRNNNASFEEKFINQNLNKSVVMGTEWESGEISENSQNWKGKGFTYYQADIDEINIYDGGRRKTAVISFTLYHEDVVKNAGKGWVDLRNNMKNDSSEEKDKYRLISINSTEIKNNQYPNLKFYQVYIKLYDPGDWLNEVKLVAYVTVR